MFPKVDAMGDVIELFEKRILFFANTHCAIRSDLEFHELVSHQLTKISLIA